MTVSVFRGISTLMFFRLCWRAPRTTSLVNGMSPLLLLTVSRPPQGRAAHSGPDEAKITSYSSRWDSDWSNRVDFPEKIAIVTDEVCDRNRSNNFIKRGRIPILELTATYGLRANSHCSTGLQCFP